MLKAYGAEVVVCPTAVQPEHPDSYYSVSDRLVREIDGAWKPNQYSNPMGPQTHYETTGPEIWRDTDGPGHPLRHRASAPAAPSAAPAATSRRSQRGRGPHRRRRPGGLGLLRRHRPALPRRGRRRGLLARRLRPLGRRRGHRRLRRRLVRDDPSPRPRGGPARGRLVRHGRRRRAARRQGPARDAVVVVLLPDSGRGYMSKIFNDELDALLRLPARPRRARRRRRAPLARPATCPPSCTPTPARPSATRSRSCKEYGVSQMPVVKAEPPVMSGEVAGSVSERALLDALFTGGRTWPTRSAAHRARPPRSWEQARRYRLPARSCEQRRDPRRRRRQAGRRPHSR